MRQTTVRHNPVTFYLRLLLYMFLALLMRVVALAPLAALYVFPKGSVWRWLAVLCPALLLFFILPQRFSFAEALVQKPRERYFSFDKALSMKGYGEKLLESLLHALNMLKWGLPLVAMGCYAIYCKDNVDAKTLMVALMSMGKTASGVVYAVSSFFVSLLGHLPNPQVAGGLMEGIYVVLAVLGVGVAILLVGAVRNSATRYIWVVAEREERPVRTEVRRRLRGRRWRQLGVGLCNLVLWAPFLVAVAVSLRGVVGDLSTQVMLLMAGGGTGSLNLTDTLAPLITAFLLLYMPLLPARRIITSSFATHEARHTVPKQTEAAPVQPQPQSQSVAYVPDWVKAANEPAAQPASPSIAPSFAQTAEPEEQPVQAAQSVPEAQPAPEATAAHWPVFDTKPLSEAQPEEPSVAKAIPVAEEAPAAEEPFTPADHSAADAAFAPQEPLAPAEEPATDEAPFATIEPSPFAHFTAEGPEEPAPYAEPASYEAPAADEEPASYEAPVSDEVPDEEPQPYNEQPLPPADDHPGLGM